MRYKGYEIAVGFYGGSDITVHYCGDDIAFNTVEEAKAFIDDVTVKTSASGQIR